jgi:hypothetical protein
LIPERELYVGSPQVPEVPRNFLRRLEEHDTILETKIEEPENQITEGPFESTGGPISSGTAENHLL